MGPFDNMPAWLQQYQQPMQQMMGPLAQGLGGVFAQGVPGMGAPPFGSPPTPGPSGFGHDSQPGSYASPRPAAGATGASERETVEQLLRRWLEDVQRARVEPSTLVREEAVVRCHLLPALGKSRLAKLTPRDVQEYIAQKRKTHAPASVRLHHSVLHNALNTAVDWGWIARNPADRAKLPKIPKPQRQALDAEPARQLLHAARGDRWEALYVLALSTGCRIGELLALRWDDVDLDRGMLNVQRKLLYLGKQLIEGGPKSSAGRRHVELSRPAVEALRRHRARQAEQRLQVGAEWSHPDLVFTTPFGKPQRANPITSYYLPRLLAKAGLPKMTFHELRHSAITLMLSRGENISVVAQMVGHSNVAMTLSRYRHILPNEQRGAVDRLGALLEAAD
jgi:integrase